MREIGSNPFSIKKDYKARNYHSNYHNIVQKIKNFSTIKKVIESIANNYETILGINPQTDIYTLGAYIPKSLQKKDMTLFRDFIMAYNESLYSLCRQYEITFIDTTQIGKKYNKSNNNFHISVTGHSTLANNILDAIYQKKILSQQPTTNRIQETDKIFNYGCSGMIKLLSHDYHQSYARTMHLTGYDREREIAIAKEHKREIDIFQKILTRQQKSN